MTARSNPSADQDLDVITFTRRKVAGCQLFVYDSYMGIRRLKQAKSVE